MEKPDCKNFNRAVDMICRESIDVRKSKDVLLVQHCEMVPLQSVLHFMDLLQQKKMEEYYQEHKFLLDNCRPKHKTEKVMRSLNIEFDPETAISNFSLLKSKI